MLFVEVTWNNSAAMVISRESLQDAAKRIENVGKKKNWNKPAHLFKREDHDGYGVAVEVSLK
jgi:hypothetical protein